jgi:hypothetical protein
MTIPCFNLKWAISRADKIRLQVSINQETHWVSIPKRTASALAKGLGGKHASKAWLFYYESNPVLIAQATPESHIQYDEWNEDVMWEWNHGELEIFCG